MLVTKEQSELIKKFLKAKKITRTSIAKGMNLSLCYVSSMLTGRASIPAKHLIVLAKMIPFNKKEAAKGNIVLLKGVK